MEDFFFFFTVSAVLFARCNGYDEKKIVIQVMLVYLFTQFFCEDDITMIYS
jgi:hypothetical protein